jgi:hypothetical protein
MTGCGVLLRLNYPTLWKGIVVKKLLIVIYIILPLIGTMIAVVNTLPPRGPRPLSAQQQYQQREMKRYADSVEQQRGDAYVAQQQAAEEARLREQQYQQWRWDIITKHGIDPDNPQPNPSVIAVPKGGSITITVQ